MLFGFILYFLFNYIFLYSFIWFYLTLVSFAIFNVISCVFICIYYDYFLFFLVSPGYTFLPFCDNGPLFCFLKPRQIFFPVTRPKNTQP